MQLGVDSPAGFQLSGLSDPLSNVWGHPSHRLPMPETLTNKLLPFILSNINPVVMEMVFYLLSNAVHILDLGWILWVNKRWLILSMFRKLWLPFRKCLITREWWPLVKRTFWFCWPCTYMHICYIVLAQNCHLAVSSNDYSKVQFISLTNNPQVVPALFLNIEKYFKMVETGLKVSLKSLYNVILTSHCLIQRPAVHHALHLLSAIPFEVQ